MLLSRSTLTVPSSNGWCSADTHFHLNYGGRYLLKPEDLLPLMEAEDLDAVTPMAADLHTRHTDAQWEGRPTQTFFASPGKTGAFATFVRPIRVIDPFTAVNPGSVPNRLAVDAVLGLVDGLEVFCLWISELGTSKFCISY